MSNRLFDGFEENGAVQIVGCASGRGAYFSNPIGFGKDIAPPFRLPLHFVYHADKQGVSLTLYTTVNGTAYELKPTSKKATAHLTANLYEILGDRHFEQE